MDLSGFVKGALLAVFVFLGFLTNGSECSVSTMATQHLANQLHHNGKPSSGGTGPTTFG